MRSRMKIKAGIVVILIQVCAAYYNFETDSRAYAQADPVSQESPDQAPAVPGISELVPKASALSEARNRLAEDLSENKNTETLSKELQDLQDRTTSLKTRFEEVKSL